jgi:uncharacterized protein (TIGR00730 family)
MMQRVCVFCGSSAGARPVFAEATRGFGQALTAAGLGAVYGGGGGGLMGALADAVIEAGGSIVGVIPRQLVERELAHRSIAELRIVGSMHERKQTMADLSDAFVALPGGAGTMEEFSEIWTWAQLGIHRKPVGLLNVAGYYTPYLTFLDHMVEEGFLTTANRELVLVETKPEALLARLQRYEPAPGPPWSSVEAT